MGQSFTRLACTTLPGLLYFKCFLVCYCARLELRLAVVSINIDSMLFVAFVFFSSYKIKLTSQSVMPR